MTANFQTTYSNLFYVKNFVFKLKCLLFSQGQVINNSTFVDTMEFLPPNRRYTIIQNNDGLVTNVNVCHSASIAINFLEYFIVDDGGVPFNLVAFTISIFVWRNTM